ncbi:PREDICTED: T-cell leukemia/lymphoma protein 1A [Chinchilla lanigera]|uniref:T-cell leukemia/lymphoma protein 1A n=1 Tax=Chinchilla lanigera TaxID=34839 RepID=UPI0006963756|nr:PREDICTED: T-cell leukemia/lymphoma protein 1A [Chinchilla lanigera]
MAESLFFNRQLKHLTEHPSRLWIWDKVTFMDEQRRTWLPIILQTENNMQVLMRQETVTVGDPQSPTQLRSCPLPLMWQHYPSDRVYRASDSTLWRVVYHIEDLPTHQALPVLSPSLLSQLLIVPSSFPGWLGQHSRMRSWETGVPGQPGLRIWCGAWHTAEVLCLWSPAPGPQEAARLKDSTTKEQCDPAEPPYQRHLTCEVLNGPTEEDVLGQHSREGPGLLLRDADVQRCQQHLFSPIRPEVTGGGGSECHPASGHRLIQTAVQGTLKRAPLWLVIPTCHSDHLWLPILP